MPSSALLWGLHLAFLSPVAVATTLPVATMALVVIGGPAGSAARCCSPTCVIPAERGIFLACAALTMLGLGIIGLARQLGQKEATVR